eukprot:scaffold59039_cov29-Tisochrysis_lutea.AAC.6
MHLLALPRGCRYDSEDIYRHVPQPTWVGLDEEIWAPRAGAEDPSLERMRRLMKRAEAVKKLKSRGSGSSLEMTRDSLKPPTRTTPGRLVPIPVGIPAATAKATSEMRLKVISASPGERPA